MDRPNLSKCHYFGPRSRDDEPDRVTLPPNAADDPFAFLPDVIDLSPEELDLATRYENGDFSGGYLRSQIAHFRKPLPKQRHDDRHARMRKLQTLVAAKGLKLPNSFVTLVTNDDYNNRIRHNNIWLMIPDELIPLPSSPEHQLANVFYEGQGCGYWHLLLAPDHSHVVAYSDASLGLRDEYPGDFTPDLTKYTFYECAQSFDEWLAYYFIDCTAGDQRYAELLEQHPNM